MNNHELKSVRNSDWSTLSSNLQFSKEKPRRSIEQKAFIVIQRALTVIQVGSLRPEMMLFWKDVWPVDEMSSAVWRTLYIESVVRRDLVASRVEFYQGWSKQENSGLQVAAAGNKRTFSSTTDLPGKFVATYSPSKSLMYLTVIMLVVRPWTLRKANLITALAKNPWVEEQT